MRNRVSLIKQYPPEPEVSSTWRDRRSHLDGTVVSRLALVGVLSIAMAHSLPGAAPIDPPGTAQAVRPIQPLGDPAPSHARLFTPLQAPEGAYAVTVLEEGIEDALRTVKDTLAPGARPGDPAGSWQVQHLDPLEALGAGGTYDRSKVARLYVGRRVSVVRGPVERGGKVVAAATLLSPYPDATLSRLEPGTLVIVMRIAGSW